MHRDSIRETGIKTTVESCLRFNTIFVISLYYWFLPNEQTCIRICSVHNGYQNLFIYCIDEKKPRIIWIRNAIRLIQTSSFSKQTFTKVRCFYLKTVSTTNHEQNKPPTVDLGNAYLRLECYLGCTCISLINHCYLNSNQLKNRTKFTNINIAIHFSFFFFFACRLTDIKSIK